MNKKKNQGSWFEFYVERLGSAEYERYFKNRYSLFLELIKSLALCGTIKEEGVGLGSITKALGLEPGRTYGSDICDSMLSLCRINNPGMELVREDIIFRTKFFKEDTIAVVTHGVLEHFKDCDIHRILNGYQSKVQFSLHYVPTDQYAEPSFGDERLLSPHYWASTFNPFWFETDNDGKDLYLIFKHK